MNHKKKKLREAYTVRPQECRRRKVDETVEQVQKSLGGVSASKAIEVIICIYADVYA